jgi:excisionase family DNA binding protein
MSQPPFTKGTITGPKEFLSPTEAATYLRLGRKTTYAWIHRGYFPHHRMLSGPLKLAHKHG